MDQTCAARLRVQSKSGTTSDIPRFCKPSMKTWRKFPSAALFRSHSHCGDATARSTISLVRHNPHLPKVIGSDTSYVINGTPSDRVIAKASFGNHVKSGKAEMSAERTFFFRSETMFVTRSVGETRLVFSVTRELKLKLPKKLHANYIRSPKE